MNAGRSIRFLLYIHSACRTSQPQYLKPHHHSYPQRSQHISRIQALSHCADRSRLDVRTGTDHRIPIQPSWLSLEHMPCSIRRGITVVPRELETPAFYTVSRFLGGKKSIGLEPSAVSWQLIRKHHVSQPGMQESGYMLSIHPKQRFF